jgi:putative oxidoreductase
MIKRLFAPSQSLTTIGLGLLVLRVWLGLLMFLNHGLSKLQSFGTLKSGFPDPLGVGSATSLVLVIFAEVVCALLLVAGLLSRFAALVLTFLMLVAYIAIHRWALSGENSGEVAFLFLAGFVTLLITGPGKFSLDQWLSTKGRR